MSRVQSRWTGPILALSMGLLTVGCSALRESLAARLDRLREETHAALAFPSPGIESRATLTPAPEPRSYTEWSVQRMDRLLWVVSSVEWMFSDLISEADLERKRAAEAFSEHLLTLYAIAYMEDTTLHEDIQWLPPDSMKAEHEELIQISNALVLFLDHLKEVYEAGDLAGVKGDVAGIASIAKGTRDLRSRMQAGSSTAR